jgi:hypothetical protein
MVANSLFSTGAETDERYRTRKWHWRITRELIHGDNGKGNSHPGSEAR